MINYFGYVFNYFFVIKLKFIMWVCGWMNVEKKNYEVVWGWEYVCI